MSVRPVVLQARLAFESRMRGTCTIYRQMGVTSDDYGVQTPTFDEVYSGKCYLRYPGLAFETTFDSVGVAVAQSRVVLRVPFGPVFAPGDLARIDSDLETPHLVGTVLRVASVDDQSQASAQRLLCEDNQAGVAPPEFDDDDEDDEGEGDG